MLVRASPMLVRVGAIQHLPGRVLSFWVSLWFPFGPSLLLPHLSTNIVYCTNVLTRFSIIQTKANTCTRITYTNIHD